MRSEGGGGAKVGQRCHEILEAWLRHGKVPDETEVMTYTSVFGNPVERWPGLIVGAALHHFPLRGPTLMVEEEHLFETSSARWIAKLDSRDGSRIDDLKTIGQLSEALSEDPSKPNYLGDDPQALLYAAVVGGDVDLHWNYVQTAPRSGRHPSRKVRLTLLGRDDRTLRGLDAIERSAELMAEVKARNVHPLELPPNPLSCSKYGGCEHKERCALSMRDVWRYTMIERNEPDNRDPRIAQLLASMGSPAPQFGDEPPALPEEEPPSIPEDESPPELPKTEPFRVNPPESPPDSGAPRPIMGVSDGVAFDPEKADRDALKDYALARGWVEKSCAWKYPKLLQLVKEKMAEQSREEPAIELEPVIVAGDVPGAMQRAADLDQLVHSFETEIRELRAELAAETKTAAIALGLLRAIFRSYKPEVQAALLQRAGLAAEDVG